MKTQKALPLLALVATLSTPVASAGNDGFDLQKFRQHLEVYSRSAMIVTAITEYYQDLIKSNNEEIIDVIKQFHLDDGDDSILKVFGKDYIAQSLNMLCPKEYENSHNNEALIKCMQTYLLEAQHNIRNFHAKYHKFAESSHEPIVTAAEPKQG